VEEDLDRRPGSHFNREFRSRIRNADRKTTGSQSNFSKKFVHLLRRCARAVKAEWKTVDDCLRFWTTDYNDDEASKLILIRKLKEGTGNHSGSMITIYILYIYKFGEMRMRNRMDEKVEMRVFDSQSMACLKKSYAQLVSYPVESIVFMYKGRRVRDSETPASLGMVDRSIIHWHILE
jgi:hypothetical protein